MHKIKTLNKIAKIGTDILDPQKYEVGDELDGASGILVRSAKMHEYPMNPELLCIARAGAGVNNIPLDVCSEKGIVVFNTPGANARAVAELAICAILMASRDIVGGINWVDTIKDDPEVAAKVEKGKSQFVGPEIFGKRLGVIGLGAIGCKVANLAVGLGMEVFGYDPYISTKAAWQLSSDVQYTASVENIFRQCDYISLNVPVGEHTRGMINADAIALMKPGVRIINLARAELVNDVDMTDALEADKVGCYVTDFPTAQTAGAKGVIAIPHLGASTPESEDNCAVMAAEEMRDYLEHGNIKNSVNFPSAYLEPAGRVRVTLLHENIPAVMGGVLKVISDHGINVENMVNKSRDALAYTIIDVNTAVGDDLIRKMEQVTGMLRVRVIG